MSFKKVKDAEIFKWSMEMLAIGNRGVQLAVDENERLGLPNVFSIKNVLYYRMPDGTITTKSPFKKSKKK